MYPCKIDMKKFNILFLIVHFSLGIFCISAHSIYRASIFEMISGKSIGLSFNSIFMFSICFFPFYVALFTVKPEIIRAMIIVILLIGILLIVPWIYFDPDQNMM